MQMKIHLNPFSKVSLKKEDSLIILAQQDLSLADTGSFCIYHQRLLKILKRAKAMSIKHHVMAINYKVRYFL
jgi:hypothetical protein